MRVRVAFLPWVQATVNSLRPAPLSPPQAVLPLLDQASIWLDDAWEASSAEIYAKVTELEAAVEASAPDYASTLVRGQVAVSVQR